MKSSKLTVFVIATWITALGAAWAQESASASATVELTQAKAEELALAGNPHIKAAEDRAEASDKVVAPAYLPEDPMVMVDTTNPGMQMWMLEEKMGFPGKAAAQAEMNGAEARRMEAEALGTRRSIVLQARQAYWEFYYRSKVDGILQEVQAKWKTLGQLLQAKELSGQWLSLSTVRLQMETAKAVNELVTNSRALRISQYNLNHLFSFPHFTAYRLAGDADLPPFTGKEEELVQEALGHNPEIDSYRMAIETREARERMATLDYLPDLDVWLSGVRDPDSGAFSNYGFRLGVTVPLFFPAKQMHVSDAASLELSAAHYDLQGKQNEVIHMTEDAFVTAESAWRILELYEKGGLLQQTQRAWAATQTAYRNEQMPLSDYVMTFNSYVETLTNYYQAQADYGKALAELDYQVGGSKGEKP
jgi:cobalt-zinc-cadmium efflux system outer membrane protein